MYLFFLNNMQLLCNSDRRICITVLRLMPKGLSKEHESSDSSEARGPHAAHCGQWPPGK